MFKRLGKTLDNAYSVVDDGLAIGSNVLKVGVYESENWKDESRMETSMRKVMNKISLLKEMRKEIEESQDYSESEKKELFKALTQINES